jgi:integrase
MAKTINRLTEVSAKAATPGKSTGIGRDGGPSKVAAGEPVAKYYHDGGGLDLKVAPAGKSWIFRYTSPMDLKPKQMGLGPYPEVSLKEAREKRDDARKLVNAGKDPMRERDAAIEAKRAEAQGSMTFAAATEKYIAKQVEVGAWKERHYGGSLDIWRSTLRRYAFPVLGEMAIAKITVDDVLRTLQPIWSTKMETGNRVRGRIHAVLDRAYAEEKVDHLRNPAAWEGRLKVSLQNPQKRKRGRHASMPFVEVPALMADLAKETSFEAKALQLIILTACRANEVCGAKHEYMDTHGERHDSEFDLDGKLGYGPILTVPGERMKARIEKAQDHVVPLGPHAVELVRELESMRVCEFVFPALTYNSKRHSSRSLGLHGPLRLLKRLRPGFTVHGFRASFRQWCRKQAIEPTLAEECLSHETRGAVQKAYDRATSIDTVDARRPVMEAWQAFATTPPAANVVPLPTKRKPAADAA